MLSWCPRLNRIENPKTCQVPPHHQPCRLPHRHMIASSTHTPTIKELDPEIRSCSCRSGPWIRLQSIHIPPVPPNKTPPSLCISLTAQKNTTPNYMYNHTPCSPPCRHLPQGSQRGSCYRCYCCHLMSSREASKPTDSPRQVISHPRAPAQQ